MKAITNDQQLFESMKVANAYIESSHRLHEALSKGRMDLAFSRVHKAYTGASIQYIPLHKDFKASTRIKLKRGEEDENLTTSSSTLFTIISTVPQTTLINPTTTPATTASSTTTTSFNPIQWFGNNPSPSLYTAQTAFQQLLHTVGPYLYSQNLLQANVNSQKQ